MDKSSVENGFSISPPIAGEFEWESEYEKYRRFYFEPDYNLAASTEHTVSIGTEAQDIFGNLFEPYSFSFTTGPIEIDHTDPRDGEFYVSTKIQSIRIYFNTFMDQSSIRDAFSIDPSLLGTFQWYGFERFLFQPRYQAFCQHNLHGDTQHRRQRHEWRSINRAVCVLLHHRTGQGDFCKPGQWRYVCEYMGIYLYQIQHQYGPKLRGGGLFHFSFSVRIFSLVKLRGGQLQSRFEFGISNDLLGDRRYDCPRLGPDFGTVNFSGFEKWLGRGTPFL